MILMRCPACLSSNELIVFSQIGIRFCFYQLCQSNDKDMPAGQLLATSQGSYAMRPAAAERKAGDCTKQNPGMGCCLPTTFAEPLSMHCGHLPQYPATQNTFQHAWFPNGRG